MKSPTRILLTLLLLLGVAIQPATAQVTIEYLGPCLATDISSDGTVVTGVADAGWEVFRWTEATGIVLLGRKAPATAGTPDISADGTRISGTISLDDSLSTPGLWIEGQGWTALMPPMPPTGSPLSNELGSAWGMSDDGRNVVGLFWRAGQTDGSVHAYTWSAGTGAIDLGSDGRQSRASATSYNGSVIVGFDENPGFGNRRPAVWVNGQKTILSNADAFTEATAVNNDGTIVGGVDLNSVNGELVGALWRWDGIDWNRELIGTLFGTHPTQGNAQVNGMTPGAEIVVGINAFNFGNSTGFIWTPQDGIMDVEEYLLVNGVSLDPNLDILSLTAITPDGSVMLGTARRTVQPWPYESFIIRTGSTVTAAPIARGTTRLEANYPNPFNPRTMIPFTLETESMVTLEVYDFAGRRIKTLHQGTLRAGRHEFPWSGQDSAGRRVASGVYYSRLVSPDGRSESKPMVLVK